MNTELVCLTIPAFNEQATIRDVLQKAANVLNELGLRFALHVLDDCSEDNTSAAAREGGATVYRSPRRIGLAASFRKQVQEALSAGATMIVHMDADDQHNSTDLPRLIKAYRERGGLVLGDRQVSGESEISAYGRSADLYLSALVSSIVGMSIPDAQTGFRVFGPEVARIPMHGVFTYTQEQIIRCASAKLSITSVPIQCATRRHGSSRLADHPCTYFLGVAQDIATCIADTHPGLMCRLHEVAGKQGEKRAGPRAATVSGQSGKADQAD
jgi:hypothetical protein